MTYVNNIEVYAWTKMKAAKVQTPATSRNDKRFDVQGPPEFD
jgi:hypothetical protein